jgi:predicted nucleic acid-binding protein
VIVVDASAIVHALVDVSVAPDLLDMLAREPLHAPALIDFEVASALRGHALGGRLDGQRLAEALRDFGDLTIERYQMTSVLDRVLALKDNFTVYDAAYVVLALGLEAPLLTCDYKLTEAQRLGVMVEVST